MESADPPADRRPDLRGDPPAPGGGPDATAERRRRLRGRRSPAGAARATSRRVGNVSFLIPPPAPPAVSLAGCLDQLQQAWLREDHLAALWQAWPRLAGAQLAPHCRPLSLQAGVLSVGAAPGPWLQALQYNRHQLLGALRGAGFAVREVRVRQHHGQVAPTPGSEEEAAVWARHPSRCDGQAMATCPNCGRPAPAGEMAHWGYCSFCRRAVLADQGSSKGSPR